MGKKKCGPTIRNLSVALSVTLVLCAGAITAALLYSAGEKAINDTRETGDRAFERAMRDGKTNVEKTMRNLIDQIMNQINNDIINFLSPPARHSQMLTDFMEARGPQESKDINFFNTTARENVYHQFVQGNREGLTALTLIQMLDAPQPVQMIVYTENDRTANNPRPHGFHSVSCLETLPGAHGEPAHAAKTYGGVPDGNGYLYHNLPCDPRGPSFTMKEIADSQGAKVFGACEKTDLAALSSDNPASANMALYWTEIEAPAQAWGPLIGMSTEQLYLTVYQTWVHPGQANRAFDVGCPRPAIGCVGDRVGMALGTISVREASTFTRDIVGSLGMPDAAARMYIVQSDNPAGTDVLIGASHGKAETQLDEPAAAYEEDWGTPTQKNANTIRLARDSDDPLIQEHASLVVAQCEQSCQKCGKGMFGERASRQAVPPRVLARRGRPASMVTSMVTSMANMANMANMARLGKALQERARKRRARRVRALNETDPVSDCVDDPDGIYEASGFGCSMMVGMGCETDLNSLSPQAPVGTFIKGACPLSCDNCPEPCIDDPDGIYAASGFGCSMMVGMGCDTDLNSLSPQAPVGTYIRNACPHSCDNCDGGTSAPIVPPPPPPEPTPAPPCESDMLSWEDFAVIDSSAQRRAGVLSSSVIPTWSSAAGTSYYIAIRPITDDKKMQFHVVLLIEEDEALKEILAAEVAVRAAMQSDKKKTDDDKNKSMMVTVIIVVVIVVLLLILSVIFALAITGPLKVLHDEMGDVAQMKLDSVDLHRPWSKLGEVRSMEKSFRRMVRSMIEYRSYMPQSLLVEEDEDEYEPDDMDDGGSKRSRSQASRTAHSRSRKTASKASMRSSQHGGGGIASTVASSQTSLALRKHMAKHTAQGIKKKKISLHVVNVVGFHKHLKESEDKLLHRHANMVESVLAVVNAGKGVSDCFLGDRIFSSFNAVKPMGTHRTASVKALLDVRMKLGESTDTTTSSNTGKYYSVSSSVSCGDTRIGNVGCPGMKKFGFFGSSVTWVHALERYNRHWLANGMCDPEVQADAKNSFLMRELDIVLFPKHTQKPIRVFEIMGAKTVGEDEWMYQLEEGEKNDPYAGWADMMAAYFQGDMAAAKEKLGAVAPNPACGGEPLEIMQNKILAGEAHENKLILYH